MARVSGTGGGTHAVVIGGSMAGLLGARVLATYFDRVTVIERDWFPEGPEFRAGVPQSRHLHVLLVKGLELLEQFFPGLRKDLLDAGAEIVRWPADVLWLSPVGWSRRFPKSLSLLSASRELFEWGVRRRLAALPNVRLMDGHEATGLLASRDNADVTGVQVRKRAERGLGGTGVSTESTPLPADLVLDAGGRNSHAPRWLVELGYAAPSETTINPQLGYASRYYARPKGLHTNWKGLFISARPDSPRGGIIFPIEGDRWLVTLAGYGADYPPTDEAGFMEFARSLRSRVIYEALDDAAPLSPIRGYQRTENHWRHYERLDRWPERLLVTGDAVCAFNPVYGQGMTAAALAATTLDRCLREQRRQRPNGDLNGLARRFQREVAKRSGAVWLLATGEDLRYPTTQGAKPDLVTRLFHRYVDRVMEVATEHADVHLIFVEVLHLLRPPRALFRPEVLLPALRGRRAGALDVPPLGSAGAPLPA
ncbi:MAG: 2-polyprenyl-6-methoxyphenol hydroxylase-like oxidoreductase [Chloroflexi bacterium]|nr:2-polyprenyl-6-methoxyphenol hydroxylase-like oxidoreductase [Chloroflexota bacterium]